MSSLDRRPTRRQLLAAGLILPAAAAVATVGRKLRLRDPSDKIVELPRNVVHLIDGQPTIEGAGVHLRRTIGSQALSLLDPFLLLDEFHTETAADYLAGFPTHPHRGFETVTYMIAGAFEHRDILGNHGRLTAGSAQWMTAGHGIVHSEMPGQRDGLLWGFQLWTNLPAQHKLMAPRYQDIAPERIVESVVGDARVRLVAGSFGGQTGPVEGILTAPLMMDVKLDGTDAFVAPLPKDHNAFVYVIEGSALLGGTKVAAEVGQLAVLGPGDAFTARADKGGARFLLVAGRPLNEPVARYGPFVMNTRAELQQAVEDYQSGRLVQM